MTTTAPAAIYVRMSKDRTGAGLGIGRQERECRALADSLGLTVARVYADNDVSGYRSRKPRSGYLGLLADIKAGRVGAVICWHLDRLTRRTAELEDYLAVAEKIPTYTVSGGSFDLTTPSGRATAKTVGAWAQAEVEQKAERQKSKNRQLAEGGHRMPGGPVPFGYSEDRITPHPVYGDLVRQAYADVLAGRRGLAGVAVDWQEAGAPVPQSKSGRWDRMSVKRVLLRETNAGLVVHRGEILSGVEAQWEPLVSVADFYAVRGILLDPARRTSPGAKPKHLLSGILTCGTCGSPMRRQTVTGRDPVYGCSNTRSRGGDCARPVSIPYPAVTEWFVERFLAECGDRPGITVGLPDAAALQAGERAATVQELDARIRGIALQMAADDADIPSLTQALAEAKAARKAAESTPVVIPEGTLTVAQSWNADPSGDGQQRLHNQRLLVRRYTEVLRVLPAGRGVRLPVDKRVEARWTAR